MFFWNSLAFSMIQWMLAIWSLIPLPFLKQLEHLEVHSSCIAEAWLGEFWALLYSRVRWVQLWGILRILWHCLSLGLEWKLKFWTISGLIFEILGNGLFLPWDKNLEVALEATDRGKGGRLHTWNTEQTDPKTGERKLSSDHTDWDLDQASLEARAPGFSNW